MDWNAERNRQALRHIAALFFLFAGLAERAGRQPSGNRLLSILRRAEAVAWEFVTGHTGAAMPVPAPDEGGGDSTEATRLVLSFYALALALNVMASLLPREAAGETPPCRKAARVAVRMTRDIEPVLRARQRAPPLVTRAA